jgi:hypothetical protein
MHSPTLTSTKWWPGGMGKTATHAVVMARLLVAGTDHGPHAFLVQLRSLEDHKPLPGIQVGGWMGGRAGEWVWVCAGRKRVGRSTPHTPVTVIAVSRQELMQAAWHASTSPNSVRLSPAGASDPTLKWVVHPC